MHQPAIDKDELVQRPCTVIGHHNHRSMFGEMSQNFTQYRVSLLEDAQYSVGVLGVLWLIARKVRVHVFPEAMLDRIRCREHKHVQVTRARAQQVHNSPPPFL